MILMPQNREQLVPGLVEKERTAQKKAELEAMIAQAEANGEDPDVILKMIEEFEKENSFDTRDARVEQGAQQQQEQEQVKNDRKFGNSGQHVTGEELNAVNTGSQHVDYNPVAGILSGKWLGGGAADYNDADIIPKLQEIYGDDYEITNPSSWNESVRFTNKKTGAKQTFDINHADVIGGDSSMGGADMNVAGANLAATIGNWVDEDMAFSQTEEGVAAAEEHSAALEASEILNGAYDLTTDDYGLEVIYKDPELEENIGPGAGTVGAFAAGPIGAMFGIRDIYSAAWRGYHGSGSTVTQEEAFDITEGESGILQQYISGGEIDLLDLNIGGVSQEKLIDIAKDVSEAAADTMKEFDQEHGSYDARFDPNISDYEDDMVQRIFDKINDNPDLDYYLPKSELIKLMGGERSGGVNGFLSAEISKYNSLYKTDETLAGVVRDEEFMAIQENKDITRHHSEGLKIKKELVDRATDIEGKIADINFKLNKSLPASERNELIAQKQQLVLDYEKLKLEYSRNAVEHERTWAEWVQGKDGTFEELSSMMYEDGISEGSAITRERAAQQAEGYIEARDGADIAIKNIMQERGMTQREAEREWYRTLEKENQLIRERAMEDTVAVDLNRTGGGDGVVLRDYVKAKGLEVSEDGIVNIPVADMVDGTLTSAIFENRLALGYDARDFEGWLDVSSRWMGTVSPILGSRGDLGLSDEDINKMRDYEYERDRNKGKRRAAYDKAYLDIDPRAYDPGGDQSSVLGEIGEGTPIEAVGTALNPNFWGNVVNKGARAIGTQWFDVSDIEAAEYLGTERDKLDLLQSAAIDFNEDYAEQIEAGEIDALEWTPEQAERFERTLSESVSEGVGEFVPTLIELAAITVATEGTMTALGVTRYLNGLKNAGTIWGRAQYHLAHMAIEEAKMQVAGFEMGSGSSFYVGGKLGGKFLVPSKMVGIFSSRLGNSIKAIDPLVGKTIGAGVIGAGSGEIAGVTELAWDAYIEGEVDFAQEFDALYGDYDEVEKRLLTNSLVFGIAGNMGKGRLRRKDFILGKAAKKRYVDSIKKKNEANQKAEVRQSEVFKSERENIEELERDLQDLETRKKEGTITEEQYQAEKDVIEEALSEDRQALDKKVNDVWRELETDRIRERMGVPPGNRSGISRTSKRVWNEMSEQGRRRFNEYKDATTSVDRWYEQSIIDQEISPYIFKDGKKVDNPEFEKHFKERVLDPVNKTLNELSGGEFIPITARFVTQAQASRMGMDGVASYNPETNEMVFNKDFMYENPGTGVGIKNHELVHAALNNVFRNNKRGYFKFRDNIGEIFKETFGEAEFKRIQEEYKDAPPEKLQEEFMTHIAEFISNPEVYHTKVANTFLKEVGGAMRSIIEENFGSNKRVAERLRPKTTKDVIHMLGRLGRDMSEGYSISQKFKWLTQLDKLEDASLMGVEWVDGVYSNTVESKGLAKKLQKNTLDLKEAKESGNTSEIERLETERAKIESNLQRHKETQQTVDRFKESLEAEDIQIKDLNKGRKEAIEALDKDSMNEETYNREVQKINTTYDRIIAGVEAEFSTKRNKFIADMMELQGGYIDGIRKKYNPALESKSGFGRQDLESGIQEQIANLMRTYNGRINDSFAPYLKKNLPLRFGEIMKSRGIELDTSIKNKSLEVMRESGIELISEDVMRTDFDQTPGGEAMYNPMRTRLIKGGKDGRLESGEIRLSESALEDISKQANKVKLDVGPGERLSYKDAPDIAAKHIEALAVPKAKAAKGQTKFGADYGSAVQKRANFVANHQEQIDVAGRRNLAVNAKGEGVGTKTGLPKTLMGRKRPGEKTSRPTYYQDMIGADGKPVTVKMSKTGVFEAGAQIKEGAKTGTILKEKIEMSKEDWLAETGIVDNRTPEQIKKAIRISQKKILTAEDIKFMKEEGNVDISAIQEKLPGKNQFKDPALQTMLKQHVGELSKAMSVQAIEAVKTSSPEFKAKENAAQLIEAVKSGSDPRLYSRGLAKNLSEIFRIPEEQAMYQLELWAMKDPTGRMPKVNAYLDKLFKPGMSAENLRDAILTVHRDAVLSHAEGESAKSAKEVIQNMELDGISPEIVKAAKATMKGVMGTKTIDGKKYKTLDYENTLEHFEVASEYLQYLPKELSQTLLKNLPGDLLGGRTGRAELISNFGNEFKLDKKEATDIIKKWENNELEAGEYKDYLDIPENQKTGILREINGEFVEIPYTDPIFTMLAEARNNAGSNLHPAFEGIDFSSMSAASKLGSAYGKANKLMEEGKVQEAEEVIMKAFTAVDGKAKKALYNGTGVVMETMIREATGEAKQRALRFAFRMAKANTNLTEGERALTDNRFFYFGEGPGSRKIVVDKLMEKGTSRKTAEKLAEKSKVEHSLVSLVASYKKAQLAAEGKWSTQGEAMQSEYIGIFDMDGRLELVDKAAGKTNPSALSRMSMLGKELRNYREYVDGEFTGRTLEDVLVAEAMTDLRRVDSRLTESKLKEPFLKDVLREYTETFGGPAEKLALKNKIKNEAAEKKVDANLDKPLKVFNSKGLSRSEKIELTQDIKKAIANSRNRKAKRKGMSTWDFDDTLAKTESDVLWTAPDGTSGRLNATEFAKDGAKLLEQGYKFDFSEFNKVTKGRPGPFLEKALERAKKFGTKDQFILTARAPEAAPAIKEFLDAQGFKLPLKNIVGLGNSTGAAKARWMLKKYAEGYNDMYFADDALANVEAVKYVTDRLDIKSKVQQAKVSYSKGLSAGINKMIERSTGIEADKTFSGAKAKMLGRRRLSKSLVVPGAQDFMGLMRNFVGKGEQGNKDLAFFEKALVEPFARATKEMNQARQTAAEDMKALKKQLPSVNKKLNKVIEGSPFTHDQAIRSYLWSKTGQTIPELSQADLRELVEYVENNPDMKLFAEGLLKIGRGKWTSPGQSWVAETIVSDLFRLNSKENRAEYLAEWIENKDEIFSPENMNKIEATQGRKYREALEDLLYRMETGSNRPTGANRATNAWMNFINGSVGATMFLNMRSAMLQTISATNYINWSFNNPVRAARAFANQKQYWKDFSMLWNSPMLKQRRAGLEYNVQEAELAAALAGQKNKAKAAMAFLIKKGFTPTQIADSFAIASGGASFYRNRVKDLMKKGMKKAEAEKQAFLEFQETTEISQQSSRADLISQQQASPLGRTLLAWANTPMQYMRIQEKAFRDLINRRGDAKTNISKIAYYGLIQSVIFGGLQNALFGHYLDDEEDLGDDDWTKSLNRTVDTVIDSQLRGFGVSGNAIAALRNAALEFMKQEEKAYDDKTFTQPDHARTLLALTSVSPVIGSKLKKLYSAATEWNWNRDAINEMGMDIDNPAIDAGANVIEALTNIPTKRIAQKIDNLRDAAQSNNQMWQRIAMLLGYPAWTIGAESDREEKVREAKSEGKKNRKNNQSQQRNAAAESENKRDQQRQRNSGQTVTCAAVTRNGGRCKNKVKSGKAYCSYHEKVPQGNKQVQCSHVKKNGKRCKMKTKNKSGKCMYHD